MTIALFGFLHMHNHKHKDRSRQQIQYKEVTSSYHSAGKIVTVTRVTRANLDNK